MPNPHFDVQVISRNQGQSVVAAAAYRSGEVLYDEKAGKTFDYSRKEDVIHAEIIAPADVPAWATNRSQLWNQVEKFEKRKDARLARSIIAGLPRELSQEQNMALLRGFIQASFIKEGLIADFAIHESDAGDGLKNPHAHILLTDRVISRDGFGQKKRALNSKDALLGWRNLWEVHTNQQLELAGYEARVSLKTYKEQGVNKHPQLHLGEEVGNLEKRGVETKKGDYNRKVQHENALIEILEPAYAALNPENEGFGQGPAIQDLKPEKGQEQNASALLTADPTIRLEAMTLELKEDREEASDAKSDSSGKEASLGAFKNDQADPEKLAQASLDASRAIHEAALREYLQSPAYRTAREQVIRKVSMKEYARRSAEKIKAFGEKVYRQFSNLMKETGRLKERDRDDYDR